MDQQQNNDPNSVDNATRNRAVFNDVSMKAGMPTNLFLLGLVLCIGMYIVTRTLLVPLILAPAYFIPMYAIHKDDVRGLKIWLSVWSDNTNLWEAGTRKPIELVFRKKQRR